MKSREKKNYDENHKETIHNERDISLQFTIK